MKVQLGINDQRYSNERSTRGLSNVLAYENDGQLQVGEVFDHEGAGFKEGDTVELKVNTKLSFI